MLQEASEGFGAIALWGLQERLEYMPEGKTTEKRIRSVERQRRALILRQQGKSLQEIADTLGYRSASGAYYAITSALKQTLQEPADELRTLEGERLNRLLESVWKKATEEGDVRALDRCLNIMERRARLFGLDVRNSSGADMGQLADAFISGAHTVRSIEQEDLSE